MVKTLNLTADIPASRELKISLPADFPQGPAEIVIVASPAKEHGVSILGNLLNSEFFGMWRDRTDIGDSAGFARDLRSEGWKRPA